MFELVISHVRFYQASIIANKSNTSFITIDARWIPPETGSIKVNMDGATKGSPERAGACGVIKDTIGKWVFGFLRKQIIFISLVAERWVIRESLILAKQLGFNSVHLEIDALLVYKLISETSLTNLN